MNIRRLHELLVGQKAVLKTAQSASREVIRLAEMGMTEGAEVTFLRRAPFGGPIQIAVCGTEICLRQTDASQFWVEFLEA